jgi:hypothetical protein
MAKRLRDPRTGQIVRIDFTAEEMAELLGVAVEDLDGWKSTIPPYHEPGATIYSVKSVEDLNLIRKRVALLKTRMSEAAVRSVEEAGLLDAYAALAEDCPPGVTAHVWRSYGLIVLLQTRYGKMIGPEELARRAGLTEIHAETGERQLGVDLARKHIRILVSLNHLRQVEGRWEHHGLPKSWRGA